MKLINREYAIATACSGLVRRIEGCDFRKVEDVRKDLKEVPTIDAEPVRHGKWTKIPSADIGTCSCCGDKWGSVSVMNYCPNCGAKMDGDKHESD